jgi:hypothetical protein
LTNTPELRTGTWSRRTPSAGGRINGSNKSSGKMAATRRESAKRGNTCGREPSSGWCICSWPGKSLSRTEKTLTASSIHENLTMRSALRPMKCGVCLFRTRARPGQIEGRVNSGSRASRTSDVRKDRIQAQAKRRL